MYQREMIGHQKALMGLDIARNIADREGHRLVDRITVETDTGEWLIALDWKDGSTYTDIEYCDPKDQDSRFRFLAKTK